MDELKIVSSQIMKQSITLWGHQTLTKLVLFIRAYGEPTQTSNLFKKIQRQILPNPIAIVLKFNKVNYAK
jgi:hypothetical protein